MESTKLIAHRRVKFSIRLGMFFSFLFNFPDCWELSQYDLGVTVSVLFACRVLVCNRWLYMENSALSKVVGSLIPWFVPFWAVRREGRKVTYAQGMSRHSPDEVQQIGRLDLRAIRVYLGMSLCGCRG